MEVNRTKHFRKRDAILSCIKGTQVHPSADWVYAQLKPQIPDLSIGTVYRTLALFKEKGDIISLGTVQGVERFDGNTKPHVHFVCTSCGQVDDLPNMEVPQDFCREAACQTGGQVECCQLSFTGRCSQCL